MGISSTQAIVFKLDSEEQKDIKYLFEQDCEETQLKVLIGKNIDFKINLEQTIHSVTIDKGIIALTLGGQSILVELEENYKEYEEQNYKGRLSNLNDLVNSFKFMLKNQYKMDGYIEITEDQGDWET